MTKEDRLRICKSCSNKQMDMNKGLICSLTDEVADFELICLDFTHDKKAARQEEEKIQEKARAEIGRKKTLTVLYIMIGFSLAVAIFSFLTFKPLNINEVVKEIVRLGLSIGMFYSVYIGKTWARTVLIVLLIIGILISFVGMLSLLRLGPVGLVMVPVIAIYGYIVWFLFADKDFLLFFEYQKNNV